MNDEVTEQILAERKKHPQGLMLLPPAPDKCQECAVKHEPDQPHDATSLFYHVYFGMRHDGRGPSWMDAMAHCDEKTVKEWAQALTAKGVDVQKTPASLRYTPKAKESDGAATKETPSEVIRSN